IGSATSHPKGLARPFLANLPNKTVIIKMEQTGRSDDSGEHARDRVHAEIGIQITDRAVSEHESNVQPHQPSAAAKDETHEAADRTIFLHAVAIVNPNDREVLHVVKNFEERDTGENVGDAVIAIPPKRDAGRK